MVGYVVAQDWTLPEVPAKQYSDKLISDAKDFSDEAVITHHPRRRRRR